MAPAISWGLFRFRRPKITELQMAVLGMQASAALMAILFAYLGALGIAGVPDQKNGKTTSKPIAIAILTISIALAMFAMSAGYIIPSREAQSDVRKI